MTDRPDSGQVSVLLSKSAPPRNDWTAGYASSDTIGSILDGSYVPPEPLYGVRTDGYALCYPGCVNGLVGDPESGKTHILRAMSAEALLSGGSVLHFDLDHNGVAVTIIALRRLGVPAATLLDPMRFRYLSPESRDDYLNAVRDARFWAPDLVGVDSLGEVVSLFGGKTESDVDYTRIHREALQPFADSGACVVYIDHLAKAIASREFGGTGTHAKKRALHGSLIRVLCTQTFIIGEGGKARLSIVKDSPGEVRRVSPRAPAGQEQHAGDFALIQLPEGMHWRFYAPPMPTPEEQHAAAEQAAEAKAHKDADELANLPIRPTTVREVKEAMGWGSTRATDALRALRNRNQA